MYTLSIVILVCGGSYAAVPLYRLYCQVRVALEGDENDLQSFLVNFKSVHTGMTLDFLKNNMLVYLHSYLKIYRQILIKIYLKDIAYGAKYC